jgi:hypothetical protein
VPPSRRSPCEDPSRRRQSKSACPRATRSSAQQVDQSLEERSIHGTVAAKTRAAGQLDLDIGNGGGTGTLGLLAEPDRQQLDLLRRTPLCSTSSPRSCNRRQAKTRLAFTPWRRATSAIDAPGAEASATICCFSWAV